MAGSGVGCEAGLGLELGFAVVGQECHELVFVHVGAAIALRRRETSQRF